MPAARSGIRQTARASKKALGAFAASVQLAERKRPLACIAATGLGSRGLCGLFKALAAILTDQRHGDGGLSAANAGAPCWSFWGLARPACLPPLVSEWLGHAASQQQRRPAGPKAVQPSNGLWSPLPQLYGLR